MKKNDGMRKEISLRLRRIREGLGYTQEEFAESLSISPGHYRKIENGRYNLTVVRVLQLYEVYCVDPSYLLTGDYTESEVFGKVLRCITIKREGEETG